MIIKTSSSQTFHCMCSMAIKSPDHPYFSSPQTIHTLRRMRVYHSLCILLKPMYILFSFFGGNFFSTSAFNLRSRKGLNTPCKRSTSLVSSSLLWLNQASKSCGTSVCVCVVYVGYVCVVCMQGESVLVSFCCNNTIYCCIKINLGALKIPGGLHLENHSPQKS